MTAPLAEKGNPVVTAVTTDARTVVLSLGNCSRTSDGTGGMFIPRELMIEWQNGQLYYVSLCGPKLRTDGNPWLRGTEAWRSYLSPENPQVDPDTPEWVSELIEKYRQV